MTRIIAGHAGGRRLATPPGGRTRPTSDRVREAIFSRLTHLEVLDEARVLDLYAGSGALGLEAMSRGARCAVLVEIARAAARVATANARLVGGDVRVLTQPVLKALDDEATGPFDLVFADPPYDLGEAEVAAVLVALCAPGRLAPQAVLVVERSTRSLEPAWPPELERFAERTYGETRVWYAQPVDEGP